MTSNVVTNASVVHDDAGAVNATFTSLLVSCRLCDIEPWSYLRDVFFPLPDWPEHRLLELAPVHWLKTQRAGNPYPEALSGGRPERAVPTGTAYLTYAPARKAATSSCSARSSRSSTISIQCAGGVRPRA